MGGGGGGLNPVSQGDPKWLESVRNVDQDAYEAGTNALLRDASAEFGGRNDAAIHTHVEVLKDRLRDDIAGFIDVQFGGSLRKHTYVDGISDVDALVLLRRSETQDSTPGELLDDMAGVVRNRLPDSDVSVGNMAVTIRYGDGVVLQLLPAIRRGDRVQIPGGRSGDWSPVVNPTGFADRLRSINASKAMTVVPVVKLFKAIQDSKVPEAFRLSGYHVEALAVNAFSEYHGPTEPKSMLEYFVNYSAERVLQPIQDTTGQSKHVDSYLGSANSNVRKTVAAYLARIKNRMAAADKTGDTDAWSDLLGTG